MNISTRRLKYVLKTKTATVISRISGIPQSTISRVKNLQIKLPSKYVSSLRNIYQREAYANLGKVGASASQAKRFSWYVPETILDVQETLTASKEMLSVRWVADEVLRSGRIWSEQEMLAEQQRAEESILESMRKSKKTIEDIYSSGNKKMLVI